MTLRFQLFGEFKAWREGEDLTPLLTHLGKPKTLLKIFLTQPGHLFSQDELIEWLWPTTPHSVASANLRKRISELRHVLQPGLGRGSESDYILTRSAHYCLNPEAPHITDAQEFLQDWKAGQSLEQAGQFALALERYEHLAFRMHESFLIEDRYEEWALLTIAEWDERRLQLCQELAHCSIRLGQYAKAIAHCRRGIVMRAWQEGLYRLKMLAHFYSGESCEALKTYQACARVLQAELEIAPSPETQRLYGEIATNAIAPPPSESLLLSRKVVEEPMRLGSSTQATRYKTRT
jgi:DNA-binding SARP family transcriptional activator